MPTLKIDTKKSLYDPIKIDIDGKVYKVKKITRPMLKKIGEYDKAVVEGDLESAYKRLELFIGKHKVLNELNLNELIEITNYIITNLFKPTSTEKNMQGPEEKK
jgi:hypothetical protein